MKKSIEKELFLDNFDGIEKINIEIGRRIRERRMALCLSAETVAKNCGISPSLFSMYENGQVRVSPAKLLRIREVLDVNLHYFFEFV